MTELEQEIKHNAWKNSVKHYGTAETKESIAYEKGYIAGATEETKELQEEVKYHRFQRCEDCEGLHKGNGNCTIVGGLYSAVPDVHCPKIKEKLELAKENKEAVEELEIQLGKMRSVLERWYKQYSDKSYTDTFYVDLITDTEILLWSNWEK